MRVQAKNDKSSPQAWVKLYCTNMLCQSTELLKKDSTPLTSTNLDNYHIRLLNYMTKYHFL